MTRADSAPPSDAVIAATVAPGVGVTVEPLAAAPTPGASAGHAGHAGRLETRIAVLFLGLLLGVQLVIFVTTRHSIQTNAKAEVASDLRSGDDILALLLDQNTRNLTAAARLLAADYGFRSAIALADRSTLEDALDNQAGRVGADAAMFTDARDRLLAWTRVDEADARAMVQTDAVPQPGPMLHGAAPRRDMVRVFAGRPYQFVTVPVRAPQLVGHVAMGFVLKDDLPTQLEALTALKMVLVSRPLGGRWQVMSIGHHAAEMQPIGPLLQSGADAQELVFNGEAQGVHIVRLGSSPTQEVAAVLLRSIDAAEAPYRAVQTRMLLIAAVGVVVFAVGSLFTARRITRPIRLLSQSAERLGAGDYSTPLRIETGDEVQDLAQSFETMRRVLQEREAQIRRLAYWDTLTGLPNRAQFVGHLRDKLRSAAADGVRCAVLMLDLDRFKHVNDVLGHAAGDRLLCRIAQRLEGGLSEARGEFVARLGGDEFAVVMMTSDASDRLAEQLRRAVEQPLMLDEQAIDVSAAVGIATFPEQGGTAEALLTHAEMAMYAAKHSQNGIVHYDAGMDSTSQESLSLLGELRTAVEEDQLRLYLQPKIALATGMVVGAEALVRWQHPTRGLIAPIRFIPFAERTGFIRTLTGWMIQRSARCHAMLKSDGLDCRVSVNLSTRDLLDQDLPSKLERLLARNGVGAEAFCLEITESAIMDDPQRALQTLQRLHGMGLRLSIDDFGTGYSSLAYLKTLPVHELKIDQSFVKTMERDRADLKIVRSTIDLAHNLGLSVVAEGVEDAQTWSLLKALNCDEAQGFHMARPMPEDDFPHWAMNWLSTDERLRTEFVDFLS